MTKTDLVTVITDDQRNTERLFAELERDDLPAEYRRRLTDHVIADLVRQFVAEEQFVYPYARTHISGSDDVIDQMITEHKTAERSMQDLAERPVSDPEFEQQLGGLIGSVRAHQATERKVVLQPLESSSSPEELAELGERVEAAKRTAPTRPHPDAPDTPPANLIVDPGAGLVDKIRDALTGRKV